MEVGRIVAGKYRLKKQIGEGAMGSVWAAVHEALDRQVAIKFLTPSREQQEIASARFVREAKSAARVKHRFVVDVFDFGITDDGLYYMVQELLQGEELAVTMQRGQPWPAREAIQFISQCLSGLDAVHQSGLVHRDLKPENVFVVEDNDGRFPKLLDFGISKALESPEPAKVDAHQPRPGMRPRLKQLTRVGVTLGTPCYMSPEQLRGRRDLDGRSDLYGIGVLLYQWLTGHVPYAHENLAELALQVASHSAPTLEDLRPDLGHALAKVLARALAPEPADRFRNAQQMRDALSAAVSSVPASARCARQVSALRAAPAKTQVVLTPISSPIREHVAAIVRLAPRFVRSVPRAWMWAIATCFALLVLSFSLLREARPGLANAEAEPAAPTLVISATPQPQGPSQPAIGAPVVLPFTKQQGEGSSESATPARQAPERRLRKSKRTTPAPVVEARESAREQNQEVESSAVPR